MLFFIELGSRHVHLAGRPANPSGTWTGQQARQLAWSLSEGLTPIRFLIHDRDSKFTASFDEVFRSEGIRVIHTPVQAPQANAYAERFIRTVRTECLDWLLIIGRRHLEHVHGSIPSTTTASAHTADSHSIRRNPKRQCRRGTPRSTAAIDSAVSSMSTTEPRPE